VTRRPPPHHPRDIPNRQQRRQAWPKRRAILDAVATDTRLTSGCKTFLLLLCRRSDDTAKPVWGTQTKMAHQLGRSDRSLRRYRAELETLGYLTVYRTPPQRGPDGRWHRRRSNTYYLHIAPAARRDQGAPRRQQRTPFSVLPRHRAGQYTTGGTRTPSHPDPATAPAHLPDSNDRSTPFGGETTGASPPTTSPPEPRPPDQPPTQTERAAAHRHFTQIRALLRPPAPSRTPTPV
jgi:Helix-turn-helix domain